MSIGKPIHGQKSAQIKPHPGIVTRRTYRTLVCQGKVTKMFRDKKNVPGWILARSVQSGSAKFQHPKNQKFRYHSTHLPFYVPR